VAEGARPAVVLVVIVWRVLQKDSDHENTCYYSITQYNKL